MMDWLSIKHFTVKEMACRCCGVCLIQQDFMVALDKLREEVGIPLAVTSGYRCPLHNSKVGSGLTGPHTSGLAADVLVAGRQAYAVVEAAFRHGFTGIGLQQKGDHASRYVHLDMIRSTLNKPRPTIWTY